MPDIIKIGLIEDDIRLRSNYADFFNGSEFFEIVFSISDVKKLPSIRTNVFPDIILLDLMLASGNSMKFIHKIKQQFSRAKLVILSGLTDQDITQFAIKSGANGYLLKSSSLEYIKDALLQTYHGGTPLSPIIANHLLNFKAYESLTDALPSLTKREIEVCNLIMAGMSYKMIAASINVTIFTVNQHLKNIYKKLNINSKNELMSIMIKLMPS